MRDNEYNQNMTTEYSTIQEEYSRAKVEFIHDPAKEYGAETDELELPEEYGISGKSAREENTKKSRSFKKQMLKMFTAATASVALVVSSNFITSSSKQTDDVLYTDEYNDMMDQLMLLAEEERYDEFDEILTSSKMEECIQFFVTKQSVLDVDTGKMLDGSLWIYDGEYAWNWKRHNVYENHEDEGKILRISVVFLEKGYLYGVDYIPACQMENAHIEQLGVYDIMHYSYDEKGREYFVDTGMLTGSTTGESIRHIFRRLEDYICSEDCTSYMSMREVYWEGWDNGPRGICTCKEQWQYWTGEPSAYETIEAEFDKEGNLITEKCIIKRREYGFNGNETESNITLVEIEDKEYYDHIKMIFTDTISEVFIHNFE